MQTFLPYPNFERSARVLDYKRLGKQRVEALQILNALTGTSLGWRNHPATRMWSGHGDALCLYLRAMILEWVARGYKNTMDVPSIRHRALVYAPPWWGGETFHASHRSNLLRKAPEWYSQFGWAERSDMEYVWPAP